MDAGSLFIAGADNKNLTPEVRGQNPSASGKEDSGADTFGTVLEQVEGKAKEPPRSSAPAESDEPDEPTSSYQLSAISYQLSAQAGQLSQLTIMVQSADVPATQGSDSQLAASVPDVNIFGEVLTPTAPTDQPQVAVPLDQPQAVASADQTLQKQDKDQFQLTGTGTAQTRSLSPNQTQEGAAPGDSALDGLRPGDQSGLSKSETIEGNTGTGTRLSQGDGGSQSPPKAAVPDGREGSTGTGTRLSQGDGGSQSPPQASVKAEEPGKAAAPDDRAGGKDEAQKPGAQAEYGDRHRADAEPVPSAWSEGQEKEPSKESSKEGKGAGLQQAISGAERFLTNGAQAQVSEAKSVPASQPAGPAVAVQAEPAAHKTISSIQVEVHPPDMGQVQIRVALADQTVRANVTTQQTEVREFLVANQAKLEAGFHAAGLDLGEFKVTVDQQGRGNYGQPDSGWSREPGWNAPGQGRADQEQASQPDYQSGYPAGMQVAGEAREGRVLSLFA